MNCTEVYPGLRVKTGKLSDTTGMLVASWRLEARRPGQTGEVLGYVPGHGGDVWFIAHDGSGDVVAAYACGEFEPERRLGPRFFRALVLGVLTVLAAWLVVNGAILFATLSLRGAATGLLFHHSPWPVALWWFVPLGIWAGVTSFFSRKEQS